MLCCMSCCIGLLFSTDFKRAYVNMSLELIFLRVFFTGSVHRLPNVYIPGYATVVGPHVDRIGLPIASLELLRLVASADPARLMM